MVDWKEMFFYSFYYSNLRDQSRFVLIYAHNVIVNLKLPEISFYSSVSFTLHELWAPAEICFLYFPLTVAHSVRLGILYNAEAL